MHRFKQVGVPDASLKRLMERAIEDIPEHPDCCLSTMRSIAEKLFGWIWDKELAPGRTIPQEWLDEWMEYDDFRNKWRNGNRAPTDPRDHAFLLRIITGNLTGYARKSSYVTNETTAAMMALHSFAGYGQHQGGETVELGTAISATMLSIELAHLLEKQLG